MFTSEQFIESIFRNDCRTLLWESLLRRRLLYVHSTMSSKYCGYPTYMDGLYCERGVEYRSLSDIRVSRVSAFFGNITTTNVNVVGRILLWTPPLLSAYTQSGTTAMETGLTKSTGPRVPKRCFCQLWNVFKVFLPQLIVNKYCTSKQMSFWKPVVEGGDGRGPTLIFCLWAPCP
jgi:hypothetical protein